ncbi:DoxX family protein [Patescibacteria group bacterium]|nr:DoxX family protein [Patescibacteria group bacterium]
MLSLFPELFAYQNLAPFIIRLILALIFLGNGYSKLFKTFNKTMEFFNSVKIKPAKFWTIFVGITELLSGILLAMGFLTQAAAVAIILIILAAIIKVKIKQGFLGGYDFDLLILACALALLVLGPGAFSIDLPL